MDTVEGKIEYPTGRQCALIVVTVLIGMFCASMEAMVTATLMPSILASMEGFALYPWVAAAYLLASVAVTPLFGRLADVYGYQRMYRLAAIAFLIGSAFCGLSVSMPQLIAARTMQGVGSAGLITLSVVLFGAVFPIEKRAKMQAVIAATWAVSSIVGPSFGALCVEYLSWRWAFLINVPAALGILAAVSGFGLQQAKSRSVHNVDSKGAILFTMAILSSVILLLSLGQLRFTMAPVLFVLSAVFLVLLVRHLRAVAEPILPIHFFNLPYARLSLSLVAICGALLFSLINFLPLHIQGVLGQPARTAGYAVTVIALGTFAGSLFSGLTLNRLGFRTICVYGAALATFGLMLLVWALSYAGVWTIVLCNSLIGVGLALVGNATVVATQALSPSKTLGAASSLFHFLRMVGGTLGIALMGGIQLGVFRQNVYSLLASQEKGQVSDLLESPQNLFDPATRALFPSETFEILSEGMLNSLIWVFVVAGLLAFFMTLLALYMPKASPKELQNQVQLERSSPIASSE